MADENGQQKEDCWSVFKGYYGSSEDSDITLYLGRKKVPFPAHRLILKARSPYFREVEKDQGGKYDIYMEREPRIGGLKLMLQYIYTGDYSFDVRTANVQEEFEPDVDSLNVHAIVCSTAIDYDVKGLEDLCVKKFKKSIVTNWNVQSFCRCAEMVFHYACFFNCMALRPVIVDTAISHAEELRERPEFIHVIDRSHDFAEDLAKRFLWEHYVGIS
ncbi:hypothetical protein DTO021D3_1687 [Paecilomyces variotii]|nr:hypothetical protein DTO032I3_1539 [Paecilomyces variotii]KAJ9226419.1 hypothetical protein DTO169C6_1147 [Paecilomyces variotii]KAJ9281464.1 hypothetical protein DTO021D3_1687 [Paecilomyces variotii]KAJ9346723.1 hypothetical protein DTO027B6_977 [Paecilomyces variotii]KAJ9360104.1 hypothetical protein DTO027B9_1656 [Paecilomyces variotii]